MRFKTSDVRKLQEPRVWKPLHPVLILQVDILHRVCNILQAVDTARYIAK